MKVADAIRSAAGQLSPASDTARLDAELLMAHALGVSRSDVLIRMMDEPVPAEFHRLISRRVQCEPVAYITGMQEFYGRDFRVSPDVLIPRPDSEILIETALEFCRDGMSVLDLGTGSGALLVTLLEEYPGLERGYGADNSLAALDVAKSNAQMHGCKRAEFGFFDWRTDQKGLQAALGTFDLYLCNPPYVETSAALDAQVLDYEPHSALFAGEDGLDDYRVLIPALMQAAGTGKDKTAILEIGASQADEVTGLARKEGFKAELRRDLANRPRVLILS